MCDRNDCHDILYGAACDQQGVDDQKFQSVTCTTANISTELKVSTRDVTKPAEMRSLWMQICHINCIYCCTVPRYSFLPVCLNTKMDRN